MYMHVGSVQRIRKIGSEDKHAVFTYRSVRADLTFAVLKFSNVFTGKSAH